MGEEVELRDTVSITLNQMVDLALYSSEFGAVNFALLHSLLRVIVQQMGRGDTKINFVGTDAAKIRDVLLYPAKQPPLTDYNIDKKSIEAYPADINLTLTNLQMDMDALKQTVDEKIKRTEDLRDLVHNTVVDMVEIIKLMKRVDAAETAIDKIARLLNTLINGNVLERLEKIEEVIGKSGMWSLLSEPSPDDYEAAGAEGGGAGGGGGGGPGGEDFEEGGEGGAGGKDANDITKMPMKEALGIVQERMKELLQCCDENRAAVEGLGSRLQSVEDRIDCIMRLYKELQERVAAMAKGGLSCFPPDSPQDGGAGGTGGIDEAKFRELLQCILKLEKHCDYVAQDCRDLRDKQFNLRQTIDKMLVSLDKQRLDKVDRTELQESLADKADKCQLNAKVSIDEFDKSCQKLRLDLDNAMELITRQEELWNDAMLKITKALEEKLPKAEMEPFKDYINNKFRCILEKLKALAVIRQQQEAAAAKKLLLDVNCISCDKNVVMKRECEQKQEAVYFPGPVQNVAPYLAYELDAIRKQQRCFSTGKNLKCFENALKTKTIRADHLCTRYCGGSHTVVTAEQRVQRMDHFVDALNQPEAPPEPEKDECFPSKSKPADTSPSLTVQSDIIGEKEPPSPKKVIELPKLKMKKAED